MSRKCTTRPVPINSALSKELNGADFFDCYHAPLPRDDLSALAIYLDIVSRTPAWIDRLMALRNIIAAATGLKDLGMLGDVDLLKTPDGYRVGDRVGLFSILSLNDQEVVLGDSDKHLDVKLSVYKTPDHKSVAVSTVVHIHNTLGRAYMALVAPFHKRIVPAMLLRAGR